MLFQGLFYPRKKNILEYIDEELKWIFFSSEFVKF